MVINLKEGLLKAMLHQEHVLTSLRQAGNATNDTWGGAVLDFMPRDTLDQIVCHVHSMLGSLGGPVLRHLLRDTYGSLSHPRVAAWMRHVVGGAGGVGRQGQGGGGEGRCPASAAMLCWSGAPAGAVEELPCSMLPRVALGRHEDASLLLLPDNVATRRCNAVGMWEAEDTTACFAQYVFEDIPPPHVALIHYMYRFGHAGSIVALALAILIFCANKNLWCLRNIIHTNLTAAFALHSAVWLLHSLAVHETRIIQYDTAHKYCALPIALLKYTMTASFFWMFVEGAYLYTNVMYSLRAKRIQFWMCAFVGWVIPGLLVAVSAMWRFTATQRTMNCWGYEHRLMDYVFIVPVLAVLIMNGLFLFMVMYVVILKLKLTVRQQVDRYRKGVKAMAILTPLLGVNYVVTLWAPMEPIWMRIAANYIVCAIQSTQGVLVALLFCFRNNEVRRTLTRLYQLHLDRLYMGDKIGGRAYGLLDMRRRRRRSTIVTTGAPLIPLPAGQRGGVDGGGSDARRGDLLL